MDGGGQFGPQPGQRLIEQGQRPSALADPFRRQIGSWLGAVAALGRSVGERNEGLVPEALRRLGVVPFVGQEMLQLRRQEGAEFAFAAVRVDQGVLLS